MSERNWDRFHDDDCPAIYGRAVGTSGPCHCAHQAGCYCEEYAVDDLKHCSCWKGQEAANRTDSQELDRLRVVIENAPHEEGCPAWWEALCTCWKAQAL